MVVVLITGGATLLPHVRKAVGDFSKHHYRISILTKSSWQQQYKLIYSQAIGAPRMIPLDVIPLLAQHQTMGGLSEKVIPRTRPFLARPSPEFTTFKMEQTIAIHSRREANVNSLPTAVPRHRF